MKLYHFKSIAQLYLKLENVQVINNNNNNNTKNNFNTFKFKVIKNCLIHNSVQDSDYRLNNKSKSIQNSIAIRYLN